MRNIAPFLAAIAISGCAEMHWVKDGADDAARARDLDACNRLGAEQASRLATMEPPPMAASSPFGPPVGGSQADRRLQSAETVDKCMGGKGYKLVPVGK